MESLESFSLTRSKEGFLDRAAVNSEFQEHRKIDR